MQNNNTGFQFGHTRSIPKDVEDTREIEFVISSEQRDRHGTVLLLDNWELANYKKNPVVGFNHPFLSGSEAVDKNPDLTIGSCTSIRKDIKNRLLIAKVRFEPKSINPLAEKIFRKVLFGTYRSTSVGFVETKRGSYGTGKEAVGQDNETYYFGGQELIEFSIVKIPSNTDATVRRLKESGDGCPVLMMDEFKRTWTYDRQGRKQSNEPDTGLIAIELDLMQMKTEL